MSETETATAASTAAVAATATATATATAASTAATAAAAAAAAAKPAKAQKGNRRGPGRPPSKPAPPVLKHQGIVASPLDASNRLEFVYGDPSVFKSLFTYFKNIKARDIHLRCTPRGLTFFARDHSKTSRVVASVAGEHVNWHYCDGEFWLGLNREHVEKMFAAIDKTLFKITITQTVDDPNSLNFIFKDAEIEKECNYKVQLSIYPRDEELYEAERALAPATLAAMFPIEFTLSAKQFKKSISDASNYSETLTFEKIGTYPLQLTYAKAGIAYHEVYRSAAKIGLRSAAVTDGTIFRATVKVANMKSLASSMVTDDVRILCREDADILFRSAIDAKALVVSTLTRLT